MSGNAQDVPDFDPILEMRGHIIAVQAVQAHFLIQVAAVHAAVFQTPLVQEVERMASELADASPGLACRVAELGVPATTRGFNEAMEHLLTTVRGMVEGAGRG